MRTLEAIGRAVASHEQRLEAGGFFAAIEALNREFQAMGEALRRGGWLDPEFLRRVAEATAPPVVVVRTKPLAPDIAQSPTEPRPIGFKSRGERDS